jgi:hypothetical protein
MTWAPISAGSCSTPWWWHFEVPKHVGEYWGPIHWMINEFIGLLLTTKQCSLLHFVRYDMQFLSAPCEVTWAVSWHYSHWSHNKLGTEQKNRQGFNSQNDW